MSFALLPTEMESLWACLPQLLAPWSHFRVAVLLFIAVSWPPEYRRTGIARDLTIFSRELLEAWSRENPAEKLLGMAAIVENPHLELSHIPVWPKSRLALAAYTRDGQQIRIAWFAHARLD